MKRFITNEPHGDLIELGKNENSILRYRYGISHSISETQFMVPGEQDCYICYYYIPRDSKSYYLCAYHSLCEYIDDLTNEGEKLRLLPRFFPTINTLLQNMKRKEHDKPFLVHTVDPENHLSPIWLIATIVNEPYNIETLIGDINSQPDMIAKADLIFNTFVSITDDLKRMDNRVKEFKNERNERLLKMGIALLGVIAKVTKVIDVSDAIPDFSIDYDLDEMMTCDLTSFNNSLGQDIGNGSDISFQGSLKDCAYSLYDTDIQRVQDNLDKHTDLLKSTNDPSQTDYLAKQIEQDKSDLRYWEGCQREAVNSAKLSEAKEDYYKTMWEIASRKIY